VKCRAVSVLYDESTGSSFRIRSVVPKRARLRSICTVTSPHWRRIRRPTISGQGDGEKYARVDPLQLNRRRSRAEVSILLLHIGSHHDRGAVKLMGNVRNDGYITNFPQGCCVEVPTYADGTGLHPTVVGDLPPQCAPRA